MTVQALASGRVWLAAALLVVLPPCGMAQTIYKCTGPDGKVAFSDRSCPDGQRGTAVQARDNSIEGSGDAMRRDVARQAQQEASRSEGAAEPVRPAGPTGIGPPAKPASGAGSEACESSLGRYQRLAQRSPGAVRELAMSGEAAAARLHCGADVVPGVPPEIRPQRPACAASADLRCARALP